MAALRPIIRQDANDLTDRIGRILIARTDRRLSRVRIDLTMRDTADIAETKLAHNIVERL